VEYYSCLENASSEAGGFSGELARMEEARRIPARTSTTGGDCGKSILLVLVLGFK
jgi:hypothetical protein